MITLSSVEVVDINEYYNDFVTLNIFKSSTTNDLNYVELMILAVKLDTNICGRSTKLGFMWFAKDKKLLDNIVKSINCMVLCMKAIIPTPTRKKGKKTKKCMEWETLRSQVAIYFGEHPLGHNEGHLRHK